eukprot:2631145-Amphidinium_carterae.1
MRFAAGSGRSRAPQCIVRGPFMCCVKSSSETMLSIQVAAEMEKMSKELPNEELLGELGAS